MKRAAWKRFYRTFRLGHDVKWAAHSRWGGIGVDKFSGARRIMSFDAERFLVNLLVNKRSQMTPDDRRAILRGIAEMRAR